MPLLYWQHSWCSFLRNIFTTFGVSLSSNSDILKVIIHKNYLSTQSSISRWCCSSTPAHCLKAAAFACSGFSIKVWADVQVHLKLFLDEELEGHVSLTSPRDVEGCRLLGLGDHQLLVSMSFDAMPIHVPAKHFNVTSFIHIYVISGWHRLSQGRPRHYCTPQGSWKGVMSHKSNPMSPCDPKSLGPKHHLNKNAL